MENYTTINCSDALGYANSPFLNTMLWLQILLSIFSLLLIIINLTLHYCFKHRIKIHGNLKIILINALILYTLYSISLIIAPLRTKINFYTYQQPCDLYITTWECLLIRIPINIGKVGFTLLHVIIFFERGAATVFTVKYESMNRFLGLIKVGFMWVVMFVWNVYAFDNEDLYQVKPYCVFTSSNNNEKLKSMNYILLVLDILITIMDFLLFLKNSKSLTRRFNQITPSYQLSQVYQLNENKRAMQMIFPMSVLHSLFFIAYLVTSLVVREMFFNSEDQVQYKSLIELTNVITCAYIALVPLTFLGLKKNLTKPKPTRIVPLIDEQGLYMNNLKNMWN